MNSQSRLAIIDGVRTPFCKAGTELAALDADDLGRIVVDALFTRTDFDRDRIDEVIFGCVAQPMDAANVARVIALRAGIPRHVPAATVQRNCASGLESVTTAYERMKAGRGSIFVVGGTESMSRIPLLLQESTADKLANLRRSKTPVEKLTAIAALGPSDLQPRVGLELGLTDPVTGLNMGETAEVLAREFGITREMQDGYAARSHHRAIAARGRHEAEICPVYAIGDTARAVTADNGPREGQSTEILAGLKPAFDAEIGTVTAGNSSQITDGAVALLVMSEEKASQLGLEPLGYLIDYAYVGCDPARMGLGPYFAIAKLVEQSRMGLAAADVIEMNEAFAAQVLAVLQCLESADYARKTIRRGAALGEIPIEKLNPNGGAIALGHPVGASGSRLILTALKELQRTQGKRALVTLCVGGGQGAALWLERP